MFVAIGIASMGGHEAPSASLVDALADASAAKMAAAGAAQRPEAMKMVHSHPNHSEVTMTAAGAPLETISRQLLQAGADHGVEGGAVTQPLRHARHGAERLECFTQGHVVHAPCKVSYKNIHVTDLKNVRRR